MDGRIHDKVKNLFKTGKEFHNQLTWKRTGWNN